MAVSLQINLAPGDFQHVRYLLLHQLKTLSAQVDEIILTIETKPSKGRFAIGWNENKDLLDDFLARDIQPFYNVRIIPVDYSEKVKSEVADYFFGSEDIPDKDFRGGPFYAYFFGLHSSSSNLVFHLDSDILLGGGNSAWIVQASNYLKNDPGCLLVSPLPGPPHPDDFLVGQTVVNKISPYTYQLAGMSTRVFMTDKSRLNRYKLRLKNTGLANRFKALMKGNSGSDLPEHLFTDLMDKHHLSRLDFLGEGRGLWSLHPPYRTNTFYDNLQTIITQVEYGELPEKQLGFYDLIDEVCDWSEAREKLKSNRWWKRR
jgi:hypothetical protein